MNEINVENIRVGISVTALDSAKGDSVRDGISVYTKSLITEYKKAGLDPECYAFPPAIGRHSSKTFDSSFAMSSAKALLHLSKPLKMPVDIFHVTDYKAIPMTCPVVTTLYDAIPYINPSMANSRLRSLKNFILKRSSDYADHVIAISNYSTKELVEYYRIPESKISVVYCGVDNDWLENKPSQIQQDYILKKHGLNKGYLLTVGTLQPRKNILRLLQAHDRLPREIRIERPIVVVGKRGWNCAELLEKLQNKIAQREAHWLSNIDDREELKCLYAGAEAFVFPSLYEGFGLPVLEAFAIGIPVLTSNTTSLPEVSDGVALEVDPLCINEISEGMWSLLNLADRKERVQAGFCRARELSWNRCAEDTLKVYSKVLRGR